MTNISLNQLLEEVFSLHSLIQGILSSPRDSARPCLKISFRPLVIKQRLFYQASSSFKDHIRHDNLSLEEGKKSFHDRLLNDFKQGVIFTPDADYHILVNRRKDVHIVKKSPSKKPLLSAHNRTKKYLLPEGTPIPFLVELGVMTSEGKVVAKKQDKFKQINRFLEMIDDVFPHLNAGAPVHIVDFGCGKAYLTFALYHYLHVVKGLDISVVGLDLKKSVIGECQQIAEKLHFFKLTFLVGDIVHYSPSKKVDMVITLHACNTATDAALMQAVQWEADVILSVPCCQHELYNQVVNEDLSPLLSHGILKERFAALVTDAARAQILEILGYQTQVLEFIDLEHTPKNLLIRAVRRPSYQGNAEALSQYAKFKKMLNITPFFEKVLST